MKALDSLRKHLNTSDVDQFERLAWVVALSCTATIPATWLLLAALALVTGLPLWGFMVLAVPLALAVIMALAFLAGRYGKSALAFDALLASGLSLAGIAIISVVVQGLPDGPPLWLSYVEAALAAYILGVYAIWHFARSHRVQTVRLGSRA